jgi:alpha-tubulin suppressor-like RCC1 family protein
LPPRCIYEGIDPFGWDLRRKTNMIKKLSISIALTAAIVSSIIAADIYSVLADPKMHGTVWTWGYNSSGQLGNGTTKNSSVPVQVAGLNNVRKIAAGERHCLAIKTDGTLWAWGDNAYGELGDGTTVNRLTPIQVPDLADVVDIAAGVCDSFALTKDGTVWSWGLNWHGNLGDGTTYNRSVPGKVIHLQNVIALPSTAGLGNTAFALKQDGTVWGWGANDHGEIGHGSTNESWVPVQVSGLTKAIAIAGSAALKSDGTVWEWCMNGSPTPIMVPNLNKVTEIASSESCLALKEDGTVWAWGFNVFGELGDETNTNRLDPVQVAGLNEVIGIAIRNHSLAVKSDCSVWAWGENNYGQLGNGKTKDSNFPVKVAGLGNVIAVRAGAWHSMALQNKFLCELD